MPGTLWVVISLKEGSVQFFLLLSGLRWISSKSWLVLQRNADKFDSEGTADCPKPIFFIKKNCIAWLTRSIPFPESCQCQWEVSKFFRWCTEMQLLSLHFSFGFYISDLFVKLFSVLCISRLSLSKHLIGKLLPVIFAKVVLEENWS